MNLHALLQQRSANHNPVRVGLIGGDKKNLSRILGRTTLMAMVIIAMSLGVFLMHPARVDPTFVEWLNHGDIAQHFLGWHFFRGEPWAFPPGLNPRYGLDMGSSIVFTDSIPIIALALKLFDSLLPPRFQYAGLWVVACFALQGICAWLLLSRFTQQRAILFFGSLLFVLSPAMHVRMGGHFALTAHWTILLGMYLYFAPGSSIQSATRWRALLAITALIHAYLLYFVFAFWFAALLRDIHLRRDTWRAAAGSAAVTLALLITVMWLGGWFAIPISSAAKGNYYGMFAANLASLINPVHGAILGPPMAEAHPASGIESTNYLGLGGIVLAVLAAIAFMAKYPVKAALSKHRYLLAAVIAFTLLGFSHRMYWGETLVVSIPLPEPIRTKFEFIRASGRLLWLANYLILASSIIVLIRVLPTYVASAVVILVFALQAADLYPPYRALGTHQASIVNSIKREGTVALRGEFWKLAAAKYTEVNFYPVLHQPKDYEPVALWAADHHIAINAAYFARINGNRAFDGTGRIKEELRAGNRRGNVLYILSDSSTLETIQLSAGDAVGKVDGYNIIAPGWFAGPQIPAAITGLTPAVPAFGGKP